MTMNSEMSRGSPPPRAPRPRRTAAPRARSERSKLLRYVNNCIKTFRFALRIHID